MLRLRHLVSMDETNNDKRHTLDLGLQLLVSTHEKRIYRYRTYLGILVIWHYIHLILDHKLGKEILGQYVRTYYKTVCPVKPGPV